jgi:drug/metabolite transporter (DMT)-like permease
MARDIKPLLLANLALLGTVSLWGLSFTSSKYVLNMGFPPLSLALLRFLLATTIIYPIQRWKSPGTVLNRHTLLPLIASSICGITLYFFFEANGLKLTSASNASLIIASIPVFTIIAEYALYRTAIGPAKLLGILLSIGGVYLIVSRGIQAKLYPGVLKGNFFMIGACLSWVGYIMISSSLKKQYSGIGLLFYQFLFGTLFLLPLAAIELRDWVFPGTIALLNILYLGVFSSALAYFFYLYGLSRLEPVVVSTYTNLVPVIGTVSGVLILHERLLVSQILGGAAIIIGIVVINIGSLKQRLDQRVL